MYHITDGCSCCNRVYAPHLAGRSDRNSVTSVAIREDPYRYNGDGAISPHTRLKKAYFIRKTRRLVIRVCSIPVTGDAIFLYPEILRDDTYREVFLNMGINEIREEIAMVDAEIVDLIRKRQSLAGKMAQEKVKAGRPPVDPKQREQVIARAVERAAEAGIDPTAIREIFTNLVVMSEQKQKGCMGDGNLP